MTRPQIHYVWKNIKMYIFMFAMAWQVGRCSFFSVWDFWLSMESLVNCGWFGMKTTIDVSNSHWLIFIEGFEEIPLRTGFYDDR